MLYFYKSDLQLNVQNFLSAVVLWEKNNQSLLGIRRLESEV